MRLLICFLLLSNIGFGQQNAKTINVQGKASVKVRPDIAFLTLSMEKSDTSQAKAMFKLNQTITLLSDLLTGQGLSRRQIRIKEYAVTSSYNDVNRKKEYTASNTITSTFLFAEKQIDELLSVIEGNRISDVDISFSYGVSDSLEKLTRTLVVQKAITDAKSNARNIAEALNISLKGIIQVSKQGFEIFIGEKLEEVKFTSPVIKQDREIRFKSVYHRYEVEEKELTEEISILFEINT